MTPRGVYRVEGSAEASGHTSVDSQACSLEVQTQSQDHRTTRSQAELCIKAAHTHALTPPLIHILPHTHARNIHAMLAHNHTHMQTCTAPTTLTCTYTESHIPIHLHTHARVHICIHAQPTLIHSCTHRLTLTPLCIHMHTRTTHNHTHACAHTGAHPHAHSHPHPYTHTCTTHTYTYTHAHAGTPPPCTCTHSHTSTLAQPTLIPTLIHTQAPTPSHAHAHTRTHPHMHNPHLQVHMLTLARMCSRWVPWCMGRGAVLASGGTQCSPAPSAALKLSLSSLATSGELEGHGQRKNQRSLALQSKAVFSTLNYLNSTLTFFFLSECHPYCFFLNIFY